MQNIKLWIIAGVAILIIGLIGIVKIQHDKLVKTNKALSEAVINNKAYENENNALKDKAIQFEYTVEQLNHSSDSLVQKLNDARKQLKIKDKNIKELQYISSTTHKTDSVYFRDTIFREPNFAIDTLMRDEWASLNLHLKYPNYIAAEYSFKNELIITHSSKKETINPPKKFFLWRWFQKKHVVTEVKVLQNNPYCENGAEKHIKIIN